MYERDWETVSKKAGAGSEWGARAQWWLSRGRLGTRQVSALRPSPPYAGGIWKRDFTLKTNQIFSVHTSRVEFENVTRTGHLRFVFEETRSGNPIIIVTSSFSKSSVLIFISVRNKTQSRLFQIPPVWRAFSKRGQKLPRVHLDFIAIQMRKINREEGYLQGQRIYRHFFLLLLRR